MAETSPKSTVKNIIKNIKESEIPQIQAAARELSQRVKQLEEHSSKLQAYVAEMETLAISEGAAAEAAVVRVEPKPAMLGLKPKVGRPRNADKKEIQQPVAPEKKDATDQFIQYTTPEGFLIRKVRRL